MSIPIVAIHRGYASYLVRTLAQAKHASPSSEIVLLGDESNELIRFVRHEKLASYFQEAKLFESIYVNKHMSFNRYEDDLICFQRWFALKAFMEANQMERCFHMDSDLMLYTNVTEDAVKFKQYEFTLSHRGSAHNSFVTYQGLARFCQHIMDFYTNPSLYAILQAIREEQLQKMKAENISQLKIGGIVDMTLFKQFYLRNEDKVGSVSDVIDGSTYDGNINASHGYEMKGSMKNVIWINQRPHVKELQTGQLIRFNSLHFQGKAKQYIPQCFTGNQVLSAYYRGKAYFKYVVQPRLPRAPQRRQSTTGRPV